MDNGKKYASKVLTTNDIREEARNWTLAGDVGLLAHLEQFSENIISRTQETQKSFRELVDDYEELRTRVGNVTNRFLALQNCQFVENRVYDEETPTEEKAEVKVQNEVEQEKLLLMQYKEAVEVGIKLLDTHFQEIQLPPNSDSDDDDDDDEGSTGNSVVWKPKNPYAGKKFPLLIGSAEWWADDNVGLGTEEDILDTEKIISESESDMESLKSVDKPIKSSSSASSVEQIKPIPTKPAAFLDSSSSEDLFGLEKNENVKSSASDDLFFRGSNSGLEHGEKFLGEELEKEMGAEIGRRGALSPSQPVDRAGDTPPSSQSKKVDNAFTRELMAKLTSVTNKKEAEEVKDKEEPKNGPTPATRSTNPVDDLFDETDDGNDLFTAKTGKAAEKILPPVGGKGFFFDGENDEDLFKGERDLFSGSDLFGESDGFGEGNVLEAPEEPSKPSKTEPKKTSVRDLFDDLDDDDDTLFAAAAAATARPDITVTSHNSLEKKAPKNTKADISEGLPWDKDGGLFDSVNTRIDDDDDDFFGSSGGLFDAISSKTPATLSSGKAGVDLFREEEPQRGRKFEEAGTEESGKKKEDSIFGSEDVAAVKKTVADDPFGFSPGRQRAGKKMSILDWEDDDGDDGDDDDDLFSRGAKEEKKPAVRVTAFPEDEDTALFAEKPKPPDSVSVSSSRSSLFDDVSASKSRLASVFEKEEKEEKKKKEDKDKDKDKGGNKPGGDLFSVSEDFLFGGNAKTERDLFSVKAREKGRSSLFEDCDDDDDDDGDDDLFGRGKEKEEEEEEEESGGQKRSGGTSKEAKTTTAKAFVDDDLFRTSGKSTKLRETKSDIFRQSEKKLFGEDLDDAELFSGKAAEIKPKPPNSLSLKEGENKGKTVGKLNIPDNLKVRFETAAKHISSAGARPPAEGKREEVKEEGAEGKEEVLEDPPHSSNLLKCPSRDRVKIPGRRRPQSRRARQEAIRNSGVWDQGSSPKSSSLNTPNPSKDSLTSPVVSNPLSPSTDEEDFFKVPELDTNFEKEDQSIFRNDLFESSKSSKPEEGLLFDGAPVLSPLSSRRAEEVSNKRKPEKKEKKKKKSPSIFDDDDEDDDEADDCNDDDSLFKTTKPTLGGQFLSKSKGNGKKSLFEQDSDEDDLFGGGKSRTSSSRAVPAGNPKEESQRKKKEKEEEDKGSSNFVDPLGLITKD